MLARTDSLGVSGLFVAAPAAFPAWARVEKPPESEAEAAFLAGAALNSLDNLVRSAPPWIGAWRQRLALKAAVASVARAGRSEAEAALRDTLHLTRPGADPGPAGRRLLAWRAVTEKLTGQWQSAVTVAAQALLVPQDPPFYGAVEAAKACAEGPLAAPFAAAKAFGLANRALSSAVGRSSVGGRGGEGEFLSAGLADAVLAQKLHWPFVLPLLGVTLFPGSGRRAAGDVGEGSEMAHILSAYARAAAQACDLFAELGRRAQKLQEAAPKLRAKGAGAAIEALLDDDCLSAATRIEGLSERGTRRLFERLVSLGAVRELTGRKTFRLYGL